MIATAQVEVPAKIFEHLNDVIDCITWCRNQEAWNCAKDDLIVELQQFRLTGIGRQQREVYKWLKTTELVLPSSATYVTFYKQRLN